MHASRSVAPALARRVPSQTRSCCLAPAHRKRFGIAATCGAANTDAARQPLSAATRADLPNSDRIQAGRGSMPQPSQRLHTPQPARHGFTGPSVKLVQHAVQADWFCTKASADTSRANAYSTQPCKTGPVKACLMCSSCPARRER
jgi:hypothetical protein